MIIPKTLFLAAYTSRSQAYAEAMVYAEFTPSKVLLFGNKSTGKPGQAASTVSSVSPAGLFVPDLSVPLEETVKQFNCPVETMAVDSINDPLVYEKVRAIAPELIIYSGFGGQLVGREILNLGTPFLHIHSGFLPDYRGSTTVYYSALKEKECGCSAIILSPEIDMGLILEKKKYPAPTHGVNIDYVYDGAIRSDLLVSVLKKWAIDKDALIKNAEQQKTDEGTTYYVIHPVLKHLAMLSLGN